MAERLLEAAGRVTLATCTLRGRPTSEAVEATAAILDESQTGAVYDAIVKRYGIQGCVSCSYIQSAITPAVAS